MLGVWLIDITISGIMLAGINNFHLESLFFKNMPPRLTYHAGLIMVFISWFMLFILIWFKFE